LEQPQDQVREALARTAHGCEPVDDGRVEPDLKLALRVRVALEADAAQRERVDDRLEGGGVMPMRTMGLIYGDGPAAGTMEGP